MNLRILLPSGTFAEQAGVFRMVADTETGSLGILPHRRDCSLVLIPGVLIYETEAGGEAFVAVDEGTLVKIGADIVVSVRRALAGKDLRTLRNTVDQEFPVLH